MELYDQAEMLRGGSSIISTPAPARIQAAFVRSQHGVQGSFHQSLTFPAGSYAINLKAAAQNTGQAQPVQVQVMGKRLQRLRRPAAHTNPSPRIGLPLSPTRIRSHFPQREQVPAQHLLIRFP